MNIYMSAHRHVNCSLTGVRRHRQGGNSVFWDGILASILHCFHSLSPYSTPHIRLQGPVHCVGSCPVENWGPRLGAEMYEQSGVGWEPSWIQNRYHTDTRYTHYAHKEVVPKQRLRMQRDTGDKSARSRSNSGNWFSLHHLTFGGTPADLVTLIHTLFCSLLLMSVYIVVWTLGKTSQVFSWEHCYKRRKQSSLVHFIS